MDSELEIELLKAKADTLPQREVPYMSAPCPINAGELRKAFAETAYIQQEMLNRYDRSITGPHPKQDLIIR